MSRRYKWSSHAKPTDERSPAGYIRVYPSQQISDDCRAPDPFLLQPRSRPNINSFHHSMATVPNISHPSGVVLFLILISVAILFDRVKRNLLVRTSHYYHPVIHSFFEELSTFGFVSLLAFVCKKEWNGYSVVYRVGDDIKDGYG